MSRYPSICFHVSFLTHEGKSDSIFCQTYLPTNTNKVINSGWIIYKIYRNILLNFLQTKCNFA